MGASESNLIGVSGFQIVRVLPNSPAHVAGLCPFFDFITEVDGIPLNDDGGIAFLKKYIADSINKTVRLTVFNLRVRSVRLTELLPCDGWGGVGLFGCVVEWNTADCAMDSTWHVVDLVEGSPSDRCGEIMGQRDFLLGMETADGNMVLFGPHSSSSDLRDLVAASLSGGRDALVLMVFDSVANTVREISIPMWGISTMGIDVADGYLHFIPPIASDDPVELMRKLPCVTQFHTNGDRGPASPLISSPRSESEGVASHTDAPEPLPTAPRRETPSHEVDPEIVAISSSQHLPITPTPPAAPEANAPPHPAALPFPSFPLPPSRKI